MAAKLSGKNFDVNLGDSLLHCESASLDITDNSAVAQSRGCLLYTSDAADE